MSWVATVTAIVAAGATAYNSNQTAKKQDHQLAAQLQSQSVKQRQADAATAQLIAHEGQQNNHAAQSSALSQFTQALQANKSNALRPLTTPGGVSEAYKKAGSDAALGITDSGGKFANLISNIDAPMQTRKNDQRALDDYGIGIDQIKRFSAGDDFLAQMKLRGIRRNPWIDAGASVIGGVGRGYAGSGGGGGMSGSASPTWLDSGSGGDFSGYA